MEYKQFSALFEEIRLLRKEVSDLRHVLSVGNEEVANQVVPPNYGGLDEKITFLLQGLKITSNLKGFVILREAIKLVVQDWNLVSGMTKELYPKLAKQFNTSPQNIERAIRTSIEKSYSKNKFHSFYTIKFLHGRPTNAQFIAEIADKIRLDEKLKTEAM